ncbi:hypothetical protein ACFVXG_38035 [Kitasatospora sp. NPDC058162]|uniref:hypothetical protein n=1 Tax=Kitasatospora sp. NPDC058162 TaxID=3346362 RepID=UPI0036DF5D1E
MELTTGDRRAMAAVGLICVGVAACYVWGVDESGSDFPLPYKRRPASLLLRIDLGDPDARNTTVAADDRTITLDASWSGCDYRPDLVVKESADQVTLLLNRRDASGPDIGCEDGGIAQLKAVLHHPLGTRPLTDAVTGQPVPHSHAHG